MGVDRQSDSGPARCGDHPSPRTAGIPLGWSQSGTVDRRAPWSVWVIRLFCRSISRHHSFYFPDHSFCRTPRSSTQTGRRKSPTPGEILGSRRLRDRSRSHHPGHRTATWPPLFTDRIAGNLEHSSTLERFRGSASRLSHVSRTGDGPESLGR